MKLRGFTVVEVVVAVAIVTLLAAIVIPDLWAAQQRITGEMFMNNVHDITTTLKLYKKRTLRTVLGAARRTSIIF